MHLLSPPLEESERQNKLVKQICRETTRASWFSFITNVLPIVASTGLFLATENSAVFSLLAIPAITIGGNFLHIIIENHKTDKSDKKDE